MKYVRGILFFLNVVILLGLLGCYASYYLNPSVYWYVSLLGLGYFIWLGLNITMVLVWLFIKWKYSLISLGALILGFSFHTKMIAINFPQILKQHTESIKIVSYNVQLFKFYDWKKNEIQRDKILNFISSTEADVYCFQEYFQTRDKEFITTEKIKKILPNHFMHFEAAIVKQNNHEYGLATFSKYPIVNKGIVKIDSLYLRTNMVIYTDVLIKKDTVRIYNVHLASNHLNTNEVDSIINGDEKSIFFAKKWVKKLKNGYKRRYLQTNILTTHLQKCKHKTILAGDFNDTPISYTYREINKKYKDAFSETGTGIGTTYNGILPMLRIDYVFYSPSFGCNSFKVHHLPVTDHYPIMAELYLKKEN